MKLKTLDPLFSRYSSFHRLCSVLGWCFRFINKARKLSSSKSLPLFLTTTELMTIKTKLLRFSQEETHLEYIDLISQGKSIPPSSSLSKLDVNIGEESLLRISGRVSSIKSIKEQLIVWCFLSLMKLLPRPGRMSRPSPEREVFTTYLPNFHACTHSRTFCSCVNPVISVTRPLL